MAARVTIEGIDVVVTFRGGAVECDHAGYRALAEMVIADTPWLASHGDRDARLASAFVDWFGADGGVVATADPVVVDERVDY